MAPETGVALTVFTPMLLVGQCWLSRRHSSDPAIHTAMINRSIPTSNITSTPELPAGSCPLFNERHEYQGRPGHDQRQSRGRGGRGNHRLHWRPATADGSGNYSFAVSDGWSGTVTPSKFGYTFSPASRTYTNSRPIRPRQDYTRSSTPTPSPAHRDDGAGATITYTGGLTTVDRRHGKLFIYRPHGWSGTVTPSKSGYAFTPASRTYSVVTANQTSQDYTAGPIMYTISGTAGTAGCRCNHHLHWRLDHREHRHGGLLVHRRIRLVRHGDATEDRLHLSPASRSYTNVTTNQTAQDYTAISTPGPSLAMQEWQGQPSPTPAGPPPRTARGTTRSRSHTGWSGTVTPSKTGYTFSPSSRTYSYLTSNQTNQNYTATPVTYTISGSIGTAGAGATITYTGGSTTANGSGNYSFTVADGWSGTVTPSKTGYTFRLSVEVTPTSHPTRPTRITPPR